jgi:uncharacterized protein (DUF433 family)
MLLDMYPALTLDDLRAAWRYVDSHPDEIAGQIAENEES